MRRFPSLALIAQQGSRALLRFPLALAAACLAGVLAVILVDGPQDNDQLVRLLTTATLGIPLFFALAIFLENQEDAGVSPAGRLLTQLGGFLFLVAYYLYLPSTLRETSFLFFVQLAIALHLLVAFLPYLRPGRDLGFWQYNKTLFLRLLAALVFTFTLFAGLSIALLALDNLLGVEIDGKVYPRLFCVLFFVFNTWYFAGGIPERLRDLDEDEDYPKILRIFAQYILAPLVAVYLAILAIYLIKVLITTQWPSGWIGYLVSSVAAVGILSLALLHPLVEQKTNAWIRTYSRAFYLLLLPAIVMLLMAIFKRIAQYGVTERRYFLAVLALWLAAIALYFLLSRRKALQVIPITLCLVALGTSIGPWGAYGVSRRSQIGRLETLLVQNGRLVDGRIVKGAGIVPLEDRKEMSAILDYLIQQHGSMSMAPWFDDSLRVRVAGWEDDASRRISQERSAWLMAHMGCDYLPVDQRRESSSFSFALDPKDAVIEIGDYEYCCEVELHGSRVDSLFLKGESFTLELLETQPILRLASTQRTALAMPLAGTMDELKSQVSTLSRPDRAPRELMTLSFSQDELRLRLVIRNLNWRETDEGPRIGYLQGTLLMGLGD